MKGAPWFKLWVADFRGGTMEFTNSELGAYVRLLLAQWEKGSIPADAEAIAMLACGTVSQNVMSKFKPCDGGRLKNARMEEERVNATEKSLKAAEAGRIGGLRSSERYGKRSSDCLSADTSERPTEDRGQSTEDRGEKKETENSSARAFSGHPLSAMVESLSRCQAVDGFPANRVGPMQWANVLQAFPVDDVTARAVEEFVVDCLTMGRWDDRKSPVSRLRSWIERARKSQGQPAVTQEKPRGTWDLEKQIELLRSERERLYMSDFQNTGGPERNADRYAKWLEVSKRMRDLQAQIAGKA